MNVEDIFKRISTLVQTWDAIPRKDKDQSGPTGGRKSKKKEKRKVQKLARRKNRK